MSVKARYRNVSWLFDIDIQQILFNSLLVHAMFTVTNKQCLEQEHYTHALYNPT